jgi:hypothetical protein
MLGQMSTFAPPSRTSRVLSWHEELCSVENDRSLPPAAHQALAAVLNSFRAEDEREPEPSTLRASVECCAASRAP